MKPIAKLKAFAKKHQAEIGVTAVVGTLVTFAVLAKRKGVFTETHDLYYALIEKELSPAFAPKFAELLNDFDIPNNIVVSLAP